ncbi:MAG: glycosyl hydrolase, partial [Terracidiphilus sp.]
VGFIHRKLADADVYFVANTGNQPHAIDVTFRVERPNAEWWDPMSGDVTSAGSAHRLHMDLAPYESRVVVFTNHVEPLPENPVAARFDSIDLAHDWKVTFDKTGAKESMTSFQSWTGIDDERYYSGTATYERTIQIPENVAKAGRVLLDFGVGTPVPRTQLHQAGTRTWYDAPLRDVAQVYVNGKLAGSVWHPPYNINVAAFLHPGTNDLKIVVANTAINELAGRSGPDYRLLNLRYGERFTPQDMDHLEPQPSGILGPLRLISAQDAQQEEGHQ